MAQNPGGVITEGDLAGLVRQVWPLALRPTNLISGFCKSGIQPLNPGHITDHHLALSIIYTVESKSSVNSQASTISSEPAISEQFQQSSASPISAPSSMSVHSNIAQT